MPKQLSLLDGYGCAVWICGEIKESLGEDSFVVNANDEAVLAGVFDGCGGSGAKRYQAYEQHTGAYISSRAVSGACEDWFVKKQDFTCAESWSQEIKTSVDKCLNRYKSADKTPVLLKSSMLKDFPTTASFSICRKRENEYIIEYFWAGDSRGYFLTENGMDQITVDDMDNPDAFENIFNDGILNNVISASGSYVLHQKTVKTEKPFMLVHATDGCFNYLLSPMHFEYLILSDLMQSDNPEEWKERMRDNISKITGDDHTMTVMPFGYKSFQEMKVSYKCRWKYIYDTYMHNWVNLTRVEQRKLWHKYRLEQQGEYT